MTAGKVRFANDRGQKPVDWFLGRGNLAVEGLEVIFQSLSSNPSTRSSPHSLKKVTLYSDRILLIADFTYFEIMIGLKVLTNLFLIHKEV